ncbi:DUF3857 domain-containing protein [Dokdonia sp. R86516]|uniref:DUF3857 domain-containing protein n=1 Tax=Dokdonia sp. R86516 TaxID=3093856 RepID=UPI0037CBF031
MINKFLSILICVVFASQVAYAQNYKFGKVSKEELLEVKHPSEPQAEAAILYRNFKTTFIYTKEKGFTALIKRQERIKIYNKDNNDWLTVSVYLYQGTNNSANEVLSGLKAYTYNYDGDIEKIKLDKKQVYKEEVNERYTKVTFTMPNIKNGSVIEYEYSIRTPYLNEFDKFYFQESIPIKKVELSFEAPEYLEYKIHRSGWLPFKINTSSRGRKLSIPYKQKAQGLAVKEKKGIDVYEFNDIESSVVQSDVPSLKKEPFSGNVNNYRSTLQFELSATRYPNQVPEYYSSSWEDVAKKIYDSPNFGGQLRKKGFFKDDVDHLIAGLSKKEATLRIYDYVKSKMVWDNYYGIYVNDNLSSVYKENTGSLTEINLLLVSMLQYAGIDSSPVILGTKSNGIFLFPTRSGFNAVIASAKIGGDLLLLDASDKMSSPNVLKPELLNWFGGRLLKEDGVSEVVKLIGKQAIHDALVNVKIDEVGAPIVIVNNRYTHNDAYGMRKNLSGKDASEMSKFVSSIYNDYEILDLGVEEKENVSKPLKISFKARVDDYFETIGDKIYISPLLFFGQETNVFKAEERKLPIDYDYGRLSRFIFNIEIPDGYQVESMPESLSVSLAGNIGFYKYIISKNVNGVTISVQRSINESFLAADSYGDLKKFYEAIVSKETEKIVLSKI